MKRGGSVYRKHKSLDEGGIFSLASAHITLETKLALRSTNRCGICIKNVSGAYFSDTIGEVQELLRISSGEFHTRHVLSNDKFGYLWIMIRGISVEDILVALNGVADSIIDRGFKDQILAAVFEFRRITNTSPDTGNAYLGPQYLVYNYKREKFYPFVPQANQEKRLNTEELRLMSIVSKELSWETDMSAWYPLWNMPFDRLGK